jgi:hypothetical protein
MCSAPGFNFAFVSLCEHLHPFDEELIESKLDEWLQVNQWKLEMEKLAETEFNKAEARPVKTRGTSQPPPALVGLLIFVLVMIRSLSRGFPPG